MSCESLKCDGLLLFSKTHVFEVDLTQYLVSRQWKHNTCFGPSGLQIRVQNEVARMVLVFSTIERFYIPIVTSPRAIV